MFCDIKLNLKVNKIRILHGMFRAALKFHILANIPTKASCEIQEFD